MRSPMISRTGRGTTRGRASMYRRTAGIRTCNVIRASSNATETSTFYTTGMSSAGAVLARPCWSAERDREVLHLARGKDAENGYDPSDRVALQGRSGRQNDHPIRYTFGIREHQL